MLFALFLSCLLAFAQAKCSLKLTLKDSYGDGWNDNSLTLTSRGTNLALTPSAGFAALNADGEATLSAGSEGSFTFSVEAGEPVEFKYEYTIYANENSWRVELADSFAPFTPVVLTTSSFTSSSVPTCENIGTVICGPVAPAVSDVNIIPGVYAQEVKFDWPSLAVSDSDSTVSYTVSFRDIADSNPNNWILLAPPTFQSEISAVFPPSKTVQVQIVAVNQYGAGTPYLFTYTTPAYSTASVWVKLLDSAHNGWGAYNGFVFIQLSNFAYGSLTFPCADNAICTEISYEVKIPVGVAYTAKFTYQAPSDGGADCSWKILNSADATSNALFDSQQDAQGPVMKYFEYTVNYPGTPTKTPTGGGTTPTTMPCPGSEPTAGAACTGLTPSGGCAYESSCCCPSEAIAANKYCVSNTYTCSGASGATWQAAVATPVCVADPTFTCPSDCPSTAPASKVGQSCSAALTCNYPTSCGGTSGCTKTATYLCTGSASLVWQTSTACSCTNITSCAAWEILVTSGDCCTTPPYCQTDPSSTNCLTPTAWTTCAPNSGTCGAGTQTRTTYTRGSNKQCLTNKETQSCTIPCPVPCVGAWGNYSSCSVSCGQGIKTRKFTVTQQAQNGGTPCSVADGTVDSAQCEIVCAVTPLCTYIVDAFDAYGDGWDTSLVKITYTGAPANLSIKVPFVDGSTSQKTASVNFQVAKGNVVTFTYTLNQEGYPQECSFAVAAGIQTPSGVQRVGSDVLQNPVGLATNQAPTTTVTLKAACVSCANASPAYCAGLNRVTCEIAQVADDQCGACLSGYTAAVPTSGRTTCTDINECAATTNPCGSNAICTNIVGSFNCTCQTGFSMINGACLSGSCPTYRLRKEFTDLSDAEKDRFIRATLALGKTFWAQTRDAHAAASTGSANVHVDNWFLPWHRGFLKDVEDAFYVLDGDLRCTVLPYWDWTRTSEQGSSANAITYLKNKIFTNAKSTSGQWLGLGAKASTTWASDSTHPLKTLDGYRANWADLTWTAYGPSAIYGGALTKTNYNDLTTFLVNGGHGTLHGYIGGMMGYLNLAAGDPIFFLHHGFLEVLHSAWQVCKGYTNRDNVPAAAWPTSPHPIGQKMPICLTKTYSWYDLYSNDILKIKFGQSFLTRVSAASSSYCPAGASSGMFAFVEIGKKKAASVYVVGSPVVNNSTGASYTTTPTEAAPLGSNNKNKNKKERRKVSYKVEKPEETHLDTQNTQENQAALDNYAESSAAFKKVLKETGDVQQAYSASVDVECNRRTDWTAALTTSPQMISDMKMERMCAMGHCYHECYLRQQGRNKNAYKSDYQNKVDKGQEKSVKEWRRSHKKNSCNGEKPTKNKKRGRRAYLDVGFNATMAQF